MASFILAGWCGVSSGMTNNCAGFFCVTHSRFDLISSYFCWVFVGFEMDFWLFCEDGDNLLDKT
jgi:hypothetical protein